MNYEEWQKEHAKKKLAIVEKNNLSTIEEIVKYFDFDNMVEKEPDFCPLYKDNIKCHDMDKLNCYYCGCPHIVINNDYDEDNHLVKRSQCSINSKFASEYYEAKSGGRTHIHCDCSDCHIPHKESYVRKALQDTEEVKLKDCGSMLDYLRQKQKIVKNLMYDQIK